MLNQVLLSLILHRKTGSREVLDTMHRLGYGISYTETLFIEDRRAEWDRNQNKDIPANISKNVPTTLVADNIYWKNKSIGGEETHNTNCILIQHEVLSQNLGNSKVSLTPNYDFDKKKHKSFKSTLSNLPDYYCKKGPCNKFKFRNSADITKVEIHSVKASLKTIAWVLCMLDLDNEANNLVPAWSAFQSITCKKLPLCEVNIGYFPAIRDTPTKYGTIYKILKTAQEIMQELELGFIYLEVDQAIHHKVLDVKFQLLQQENYEQFKSIIVRMGGFHITICLMRSIFSWFHGFGFVDLLSAVGGLGGPRTIESVLTGGDFKVGETL